ncbi:MAG TPA: DegT/DnrJ/EryC1/StrS family aminotransferase [Planctomycetota bacterium]|nr:DegT/DnrJ/EryC1/StrS family aminotransferase [Planctomycetota bacterium]
MTVPFMDLNRATAAFAEDWRRAALRVLDHKQFILGKEVEAFETAMGATLDGAFAIGTSSGTDALLAGLMALGVGRGDRVLTSPFSFFATAGTIMRLGAVPVFADIDPAHFGLDARRFGKVRREEIRAIVPVHLFGHADDLDLLLDWAGDVPVLEDACQAIGSKDAKGRVAGTVGAIGAFSFFPTKNLGAAGDAGMCVTRDPARRDALKQLRAHGQTQQYHHAVIGGNFRLDAMQAAFLAAALPHLPALNATRRENAARYAGLLKDAGLLDGRVQAPQIDAGHSVHQYVVRIGGGRRDAVQARLKERGVGTMVYYPVPFHLQECFRDLGYRKGDFPESERAAAEVLALPIFPGLTAAEQEEVVRELKTALS